MQLIDMDLPMAAVNYTSSKSFSNYHQQPYSVFIRKSY